MIKNILVTGANGQLGSEIKQLSESLSNYHFTFTDVDELDITNKQDIESFIIANKIHIIINCAAYTAVDKAESEKQLADEINHFAVKYLAEVAKAKHVQLIHISTDYVFDGKGFKPYTDEDDKNPLNVYGKTKLEGEKALLEINPEGAVIVRTSWVYSSFGNNFVKTMLRLGEDKMELNVICDQVGAPTYARDLASCILQNLLDPTNKEAMVYHFTNEGVCSWYDFALEIMSLGEKECKVKPIPTSAYPTPAQRPFYSLLDKSKIKEDYNIDIPYWKSSLKKCIEKIQIDSSESLNFKDAKQEK
ncbi:dTDP-4-dehydrorhamnose reductase [Mesonia ostreae]|uniref:dTDP-4-dehydrorhamnose reductase n=1 Tax=Mesonia ostreae TaxID=861110 RepID=A0ABU2KH58_9FLAO|nr:dTDP-4-dehydrorhamnose reductase [Mesonia ostreae]MDT0294048.1 dTDP-4-dehydrorhamnose reductase [Mesonia ostreae]